jgi:protein-S-isoprenylcysteine O-methyltransferase Ste14
MPNYLASLSLLLLFSMVLTRVLLLKRRGINAMHFGNIDKKDFIIPPFALFYFYLVFAAAFHFPSVSTQQFFHSALVQWAGVLLCLAGLSFFLWSLLSFGQSFRVGIDKDHPDKLITTGIFAFSRNPIYAAFAVILIGQFLIFPKLAPSGLSLCRRLVVPSSGAARRSLFKKTLRRGILRLLQSCKKVFVNGSRRPVGRPVLSPPQYGTSADFAHAQLAEHLPSRS